MIDVFEVTPADTPEFDCYICRTWQQALDSARHSLESRMEAEPDADDYSVRIRAIKMLEEDIPEEA